MISIGMPSIAAQYSGMNGQSIMAVAYVTAEPIQFTLQGAQSIGLVAADVSNAS